MRFEVYVPDYETEVISKFREKGRSPYVVSLVKDNLNGKKNLTEEEVINLIIKHTQNKSSLLQQPNKGLTDSIKSVLDILD